MYYSSEKNVKTGSYSTGFKLLGLREIIESKMFKLCQIYSKWIGISIFVFRIYFRFRIYKENKKKINKIGVLVG